MTTISTGSTYQYTNNSPRSIFFAVEVIDPSGINIKNINYGVYSPSYVTILYKKINVASPTDVTPSTDADFLNDFTEIIHVDHTGLSGSGIRNYNVDIDITLPQGIYAFIYAGTTYGLLYNQTSLTSGDIINVNAGEISTHVGWVDYSTFVDNKPTSFTGTLDGFAPSNFIITYGPPTITSTIPSHGETSVSLDSNIQITFDEDVVVGTGNVTIKRVRDDAVIEVIDVTGSQVSISSDTMTINPSNNLEFYKSFYVEIDADAVRDSAGNDVYGGLSGSSSFSFSTICFSENTPIQQLVNGQIQETPIKNLQTGDTLMTKHGPQTLSRLVKQPCYSKTEYVFFPQGCFQENLPSQDLWVTGAHPISLGYVSNKKTNGGKSNLEQDDHVFIHMQAADLVGKLPGIEKVKLSESHVYNLIFDIHTSVDVAGMEFLSHHPNPHLEELPKLNSWEYQDSGKTAKKDQPYYLKYKNLIRRHRPKGSELSQFLSQCVSSDPKRKFKLGKLGKNDLVVKKKQTQVKAI